MRQDGVFDGRLAAVFLVDREVLEGGYPVAPPVAPVVGDLREVRRAPELLRAGAFGHLACELRDVTLLSCPDELSLLHAERLSTRLQRLGRVQDPARPSTCSNVMWSDTPAADGSSDMAAVWASVRECHQRRTGSSRAIRPAAWRTEDCAPHVRELGLPGFPSFVRRTHPLRAVV